jgi:hypothetical protein
VIDSLDQPLNLIFQTSLNGEIIYSSADGLFAFTPTLNSFFLIFTYQELSVGSGTFVYSTNNQTMKLMTRVIKLSFTDCGTDTISFITVTT